MIRAPFPWFGGKSRVASEVWAPQDDIAMRDRSYHDGYQAGIENAQGAAPQDVEALIEHDFVLNESYNEAGVQWGCCLCDQPYEEHRELWCSGCETTLTRHGDEKMNNVDLRPGVVASGQVPSVCNEDGDLLCIACYDTAIRESERTRWAAREQQLVTIVEAVARADNDLAWCVARQSLLTAARAALGQEGTTPDAR